MSISVGDVLRVVATMAYTDGDLVQNVFAAVISGSGGPFDDADIVDDALAWVGTMFGNLSTLLSSTIDGSQVQVYVYDPVDEDFDEVGSVPWTFNPTGTGDEYTRGVAGLINAKTTDPDVNGRKYIGGLTENVMTSSGLAAGLVTGLVNFADDWLNGFNGPTSGAAWTPAIWSHKNKLPYATTGDAIIPVEPSYQRRRKRGVGV